VRERIGSAELAVIKADAYGHGLIGVAQALADDVQLFGVANLEEAIAVRNDLHPIIILARPFPKKDRQSSSADSFLPFRQTQKHKILLFRAKCARSHQFQDRHRHGAHGRSGTGCCRGLQKSLSASEH
jgi:alanine racemase